ncbi:MAG: hypothetical protein ABSG87_08075 [Verrucomicrobiota bacterium]|jgi:hypothetical protein
MSTYHNTAIVLGDLKDALLHFEYVIPMNISGFCAGFRPKIANARPVVERFKELSRDSIKELDASFGPEKIVKLYPPHLANDPQFENIRNMFEGELLSYMVKISEGQEAFERYIQALAKIVQPNQPVDPKKLCPTIERLQIMFTFIVSRYQLNNVPIDCSHFLLNDSSDSFDNCLSAPQIRVIDTTKVTIPQIMEFRKDKEVMSKMRKFRLSAYEQYNGKDKTYIEDDIQQRLADYNETVKACGFETKVKALSFLFESKVLMGTFATSAVSLLMGSPQLAVEAFGAGTIVELGKLSLEYARSKSEMRKISRENPISYIADAKEKLEK